MSNRAKAKGTAWETALVRYLQGLGLDARRKPLAGANDEGDIDVGHWALEAKNCRAITLAQWVDEADAETVNSRRPVAVVAKRAGKGDPGEAYVIMPLRRFVASVLLMPGATMALETRNEEGRDDAATR